MSAQNINLILHLILAGLYLPVLVNLIQKRVGHELSAMLLSGYLAVGFLLVLGEGFWRGGELSIASQRIAFDFLIYGALALSFLMTLTVVSFIRRDLWTWLGIGALWILGFIVIFTNVLGLGEVIWKMGLFTLTRERLAPTWAALGWLVFVLGGMFSARSAHRTSRQPLLRNRLNYWVPVFFLVFANDILLLIGKPFPGNPLRLVAAVMASFIIITHDPPDLREVTRRVLTYIITTLVIVIFYVAGFTASQTVFKALPNYNPLLVGAGIALLLSLIFTPLLSLIRRWVNKWLNIQEFHASKTLHQYSEQISNILDMQRLANVAVGLIIEAMDISRGFLFLVDSEITSDGQKSYRLRAVRSQGERQVKIVTMTSEHPVVRQLIEMRPLL